MNNFEELVNYCLNCPVKPCKKGCPLENDIPSFIKAAKEDDFLKAFNVLTETTVLSSICGRICPFDRQCEGNCVRRLKGEPVQIGAIEATIGDKAIKEGYPLFEIPKENGKSVAIVGAGPAGLTCAAFLRKFGYKVTIYEKYNHLGGIISHGIPEFRLSNEIAQDSFKKIIDLGIDVKFNYELSIDITLKKLRKDYDAVFLGFGANISIMPNIKGKSLIYGSNDFLESKNVLNFEGKTIMVIGGGDVAMDMARTARKGGSNVLVVYRSSEDKMKASKKEVNIAKEEGVEFLFNTNLKQVIKKEDMLKAYLMTNDGFNFVYPCDYVFMAIGSKPDNKVIKSLGLKISLDGYIKTDKNQMTSMRGVFAGGDLINEPHTVAFAARSGRNAAYSIDLYLKKL